MKTNLPALLCAILIVVCLCTSCAPIGDTDKEYGFFHGILHGIIFIFALIGRLFGAQVGLFAEHNTGVMYWLGFIMGLAGWGGGMVLRR
jgi:hypothetical protein